MTNIVNPFVDIVRNEIGKEVVNSVNLRSVHTFLESKQRFADWAKNRLGDFEKGNDFIIHKNMTQYNQIDTIDYIVTLDTAKHICMLERNEKGKQLRQYFISCEKQLLVRRDRVLPFTNPDFAKLCGRIGIKTRRLNEANAKIVKLKEEIVSKSLEIQKLSKEQNNMGMELMLSILPEIPSDGMVASKWISDAFRLSRLTTSEITIELRKHLPSEVRQGANHPFTVFNVKDVLEFMGKGGRNNLILSVVK